MTGTARLILLILLSLPALVIGGPAHGSESGLEVLVNAADPVKPAVVLTNRGDQPCQIAGGSTLGTVGLTRVQQEGKDIEALPGDVSFPDGLDFLLSKRVQTLEPGGSAELRIPVISAGPTGHLLEMVTWSAESGPYAAYFPVRPGTALTLEVTYSVPLRGDFCAVTSSSGQQSSSAVGTQKMWLWLGIAGAAVLLLAIVLGLILSRRKRRAHATAATLVLLLATLLAWPEPARAEIDNIDPDTQAAFDTCMAEIRAPGGDPGGILPSLDAPGFRVTVQEPDTPGDNHEAGLGNNSFVFWDPDHPHTYHGSGGPADPCSSLYHELYHSHQRATGTLSLSPCATDDASGRTLPRSEVEATHAQNRFRQRTGLPPRDHYGSIPLPAECKAPPEPPRCDSPDCGGSTGDPHLLTFDHLRYDFQAAGEFVLARTRDGVFEVQTRQTPVSGSRLVSANSAVALRAGTAKVEIRLGQSGLELLIDGVPKEPGTHRVGGAEVVVSQTTAAVSLPGGAGVFVEAPGRASMNVVVRPARDHAGQLEGLLGDFDGDSTNDVRSRDGAAIAAPTFAALYPGYADSWRVTAQTSLFTYPPGTGPESYADRSFPEGDAKAANLPGRAAAEAMCRRLGVNDPAVLLDCVIDVALTGQAEFAAAAARGLVFTGGPDFGGIPFTVRLNAGNPRATVEFDAIAGQQVFVDVPVATTGSGCGVLELRAPDGRALRTGCVADGTGFIDTVTLPADGRYQILINPRGGSAGEMRLRVITVKDVTATIAADGRPVRVDLSKPGMTGRLTFTGRKDQKVYLDVPWSTLPSQCGLLRLTGPSGRTLRDGCVVGGVGEMESAVLPEAGTYTVLLDPGERRVGESVLRLIDVIDQKESISAGGPAVTARITQPGGVSEFTFSATAGQRVFLEATSANLPAQCGILILRDPQGRRITDGCLVGGKGGIAAEDGYVLPQTGTYTIVVDPSDNKTGEAVLRLRN
jgi:hypothetical protein